MPHAPKPKKSETLEIRLPYATKTAFMARCQAEGVSASETLRGFIDQRLAKSGRRTPRRLIAAIIAAAVGAAAAPTLARPADAVLTRLSFERVDANHDGVISYEEYARAVRGAR